MTLTFDPSTDFAAVVDGLAPVTLRARNGSTTPIEHALRRAVSTKEAAASNGKYTGGDVVFHWPVSESGQPSLGSQVIDALGAWTILEVARQTLNARWRCVCRDLAIAAGLDTLVTIQEATYAKSAGGAQTATWADLHTNRRAKIQLESADRASEHQSIHQPRLARVYFAEQLLLTPRHRIVGPDGAVYKVLGWDDPDRIDALFSARVEATKWPLS